jgi:hypothetical protein
MSEDGKVLPFDSTRRLDAAETNIRLQQSEQKRTNRRLGELEKLAEKQGERIDELEKHVKHLLRKRMEDDNG